MFHGSIHTHTEYSFKDSPTPIKDLVNKAKEMGASFLAITDHRTGSGHVEFYDACINAGINPVLGVELDVKTDYLEQGHLIVLAKNYTGLQKVFRVISESNKNIVEKSKIEYPIATKEMLEKCLSGGDVIVTSACVGGVLAGVFLQRQKILDKIHKREEKMASLKSPNDIDYVENCRILSDMEENIAELRQEKKEVQKKAKRSVKGKEKSLNQQLEKAKKSGDYSYYEKQKASLEADKKMIQEASERLAELETELKSALNRKRVVNNKIRSAKQEHAKYYKAEAAVKKLQEQLMTREECVRAAEKEAEWFQSLFGDDFYIEIQNHGIPEEADAMNELIKIAHRLWIPLVASNDVHILSEDKALVREFISSLRFGHYMPMRETDKELYMKTDEELTEWLLKVYPESAVREAVSNIKVIGDSCHIRLPEKNHYPRFLENGVPVKDPKALLRQKAEEGIARRYPDGSFDEEHRKRMNEELDVICDMGYADYLLIVADYARYAREKSIEKGDGLGYGFGPGRGSGAGSLVNYLLGITNIEPLRYNLLFERFLNKERVSMPDIDADFSDEVREDTINYCRDKYGAESVAGIRTCIRQAGKKVTRNAARFYAWKDPEHEEEYKHLGDAIARAIEKSIRDEEKEVREQFPDRLSKNIIDLAVMAENCPDSFGMHAAGIIIGDGTPLTDVISELYNSEKQSWNIQCDMVEAERIGLLKMDFLGLNNLDIITECIRLVRKNRGTTIDIDNIPFEDEVFSEIFAKGDTGSVFQFESSGMRSMLKKFKPSSFEDIILLVAAYRPGPMAFIPDVIEVKHKRARANYIIPELKDILDTTYGQCIYQEQLMDIFHKCAGFSLGEADIIRRYMSKKKVDKFMAYKDKFIQGLIEAGAKKEDAEEYWGKLEEFSRYAFNKSHAAAYAMIAYQTAYLKYYFPLEYICAVLNHTDIKKLPGVLYEARSHGIKILSPDINKSEADFVIEDIQEKSIRFGLSKIKGIKNEGINIVENRKAKKDRRYPELRSAVIANKMGKRSLMILNEVGAFDNFNDGAWDRSAITEDFATSFAKTANTLTKYIAKYKEAVEAGDKEQAETYMQKGNETYALLKTPVMYAQKDLSPFLKSEKEYLGAYVSGHPMERYETYYGSGNIKKIIDVAAGESVQVMGSITSLRIAKRKRDGKPMAFFTLEDLSGSIEVNCFTFAYEKFSSYIKEDNIVKITGNASQEKDMDDEEILKITVKEVEFVLPPKEKSLLVTFESKDKDYLLSIIKKYEDPRGKKLILHDETTGMQWTYDKKISPNLAEKGNADVDYKNRILHFTFC